ncbi:ABC transporter permease [Candidatus Poribacteria bacterium]|nr:ABC transporter permease [Candidatus Poribacteria bacterium]
MNTHSQIHWQAYRSIFKVTLRRMLWTKRTIFVLLVVLLPVALSIVFRFTSQSARDVRNFLPMLTMIFYLQFVAVLIAIFHGTAIMADEIEGKTLTYLFTRPIQKSAILLSKFAAYFVGTIALIAPSHLLATLITDTHPRMKASFLFNIGMSFKYIGVLSLALLAYGALSTLLGARFKHPVLWGLLLAFGWEKITLVPGMPTSVKRMSTIHYLLAIFPRYGLPKRPTNGLLGDSPPPLWAAFVIISLITLLFLLLSIWIFRQREYEG